MPDMASSTRKPLFTGAMVAAFAVSASVFGRYGIKQAKEDVGIAAKDARGRRNQLFYDGDHWQSRDGWTGPYPAAGSNKAGEIAVDIQRIFTSQNIIKEVVDRYVGGVFGREPIWKTTLKREVKEGEEPTEAEAALMAKAEAILTEFWDKRSIKDELKKALRTACLRDRGALHIFIPRGLLVDGMIPAIASAQALEEFVYVDARSPEEALIAVSVETRQQIGVMTWKEGNTTLAELSYVDKPVLGESETMTVVRVVSTASSQPNGFVEEVRVPLGGNLLVFEIRLERLITDQVVQNQKGANKALTMMQRNSDLGGFLERTILNGQQSGKWVDDASYPGGKRFVPDPYVMGAGITNWVQGTTIEDEDGKPIKATPSIVYKDPIAPDNFVATKEEHRQTILFEVRQAHVEMAKDATASAVSRIQARADYLNSLFDAKPKVDAALRWMLSTLLRFAAVIGGNPAEFDALSIAAECKPDAGPLTPEESKEIREAYNADMISLETAIQLLGIADVDAEIQALQEEKKTKSITFEEAAMFNWQPTDAQLIELDGKIPGITPRTQAEIDSAKAAQEEQAALRQAELGRVAGLGG